MMVNLLLAALIFALAHPQKVRETQRAFSKPADVVFLLDISPSMRATDVHPSRLERAAAVIAAFSRNNQFYDRVGLVSFSSTSLILSYLTNDFNNLLFYLDYLKEKTFHSMGTNIGHALKNSLTIVTKDLDATPENVHRKIIFILISDGEDHGEELGEAIEEVRRLGIRVHTIGIGSKEGAPIPISSENGNRFFMEDPSGNKIISRFEEHTLQRIAEQTGGKTYRTFTGYELEDVFAKIVHNEREVKGVIRAVEHEDAYYAFLLAAFGIFLATMLI